MMQKLVSDLQGDSIFATDGKVGSLADAYFDDQHWTLRYFVIDTGRWLPGRKVLIAPGQVSQSQNADVLKVDLSRKDIESAPGIDADPPVSTLLREAHDARYGYPYAGPYLWAVPMAPAAAPLATSRPDRERAEQAESRAARTHLRAGSAVVGSRIRAADGEIGHVEDFVVDDQSWAITGMVVDTRNWLPGKKVVVAPSAISAIDWESGTVSVRLSRDEVERSAPLRA